VTFSPNRGQQVRITGCRTPQFLGRIGTLVDSDSKRFVVSVKGEADVYAVEVAPVWQPGEVVTEEPPKGSTVRRVDDERRFKRWSDGSFEPWSEIGSCGCGGTTWELIAKGSEVVLESIQCGAKHPTNASAIPCMREAGHLDGHRSDSGCAGSAMEWYEEPKPLDMPEPEGVGTVAESEPGEGHWVCIGGAYFVRDRSRGPLYDWYGNDGHEITTWNNLRDKAREQGTDILHATAPTPQPQTREVPITALRDGDMVSLEYVFRKASAYREGEGFRYAEDLLAGAPEGWLEPCGAVATRVDKPLPKTPGSRGTATVRGQEGVTVFRTDSADSLTDRREADRENWCSAVQIVGSYWHADMDLTDFVEDGAK
jgi:hypothetical protein